MLGTVSVTAKDHESATISVSISNADATSVYLQYKKDDDPGWTDAAAQTAASGATSVTFSLTGLDPATNYQVRSSLTSPVTDSTANVTGTFTASAVPALGTVSVTAKDHESATISVSISNADDTSVYLQYKKDDDPGWTDAAAQTAALGATSVTFSLTGLDPATNYQVRSSLTSPVTDSTANVTGTFTTLAAPVLGTVSVTAKDHESATISVSISNADDTSVYLQYKKDDDSTWNDVAAPTAVSGATSVEFTLSSLNASTVYNVRASLETPVTDTTTNVTNDFTSLATPPALDSVSVIAKDHESATISVSISNADNTTVFLQHKKKTEDTTAFVEATSQSAASGDTSVEFTLDGLSADTEYDIEASLEDDYDPKTAITLTTSAPPPVVSGMTFSDIERTTATVTVAISNPAGTMTVHLKYEEKGDSSTEVSQNETNTSGMHEFDLTGLKANTTYTVRASLDGTFPADETETKELITATTVPDAPVITSVSAGDEQFTVNWSEPDSGGESITGYKVEYKKNAEIWDDAITSSPTAALTLDVTGLDNGTAYDVRVIATNSNGDSEPSGASSVDLIDVPGTPTSVTLERGGSGELDVAWTAPTTDTLHPVDTYVIRWKSGTDEYGAPDEAVVTTLTHKITGLANGTEYAVKVNAKNGRGESADSNEPKLKPGIIPGAPTNIIVTPRHDSLELAWEAPTQNTGFDITYKVQWKTGTQEYGDSTREATVSALTYTITGLDSDTAYSARIIAINELGQTETPPEVEDIRTGEDPRVSGVNVPDGEHDATKRTAAVAAVTIAHRDDRAPTTVFLRYSENTDPPSWVNAPSEDTDTNTLDIDIDGLTADTSYVVQASLDEDFPAGEFASTTFLTASTVPGQVTSITWQSLAKRTDPTDGDVSEVRLSWEEPDNGGRAITGYRVEAGVDSESLEEEIDVVGQTLTTTFDAIGYGRTWIVNIWAANENGEGEASGDVEVEWTQAPAAPTITLSPRSGQLTASWDEPDTGGRAIEAYLIRWVESGEDITSTTPTEVAGTAREYSITTLTNGTEYVVSVAARNSVGQGEWSDVATGTPVAEAGAPTLSAITHGDGTLAVTWVAPEGDTPIDNYIVEWISGDGDFDSADVQENTVPATQLGYTISSLENGTEYAVRVIAANANGRGGASNIVSGTPSGLPEAPTEIALIAGNRVIRVSWSAPASDGGSALTGYSVQWKSGNEEFDSVRSADTDAETLTHLITDLVNGTSYDVRVLAANANGSTESSASKATPILVLLRSVSTVGAVSGSITQTAATIRVGIANADGNGRTIYMRYSPDELPRRWSSLRQLSTSGGSADFSVTGLTANTTYVVQASLGSSFQAGTFVGGSFVTSPAVPGPPTEVVVTPGDGELTVSWTAPESDGGADITVYRVQWSSGDEEFGSSRQNETDGETLTTTISDLTNDTEYDVRVVAVNSVGPGEPSDAASGAPNSAAEPAVSAITFGDVVRDTVTVSVTIANRDETAVTNVYLRYRKETPQGDWSSTSTAEAGTDTVTFNLTGLLGSTDYEAQASLDDSFPDDARLSGTFKTAVTAPGAPSISSINSSDVSLTVSWTAPESDGGSSITAYKVQWKSGEEEFDATRQGETGVLTLTYLIDNLTNDVAYDVRVIAVNEVGEGEASATSSATPVVASEAAISEVRVVREDPAEAEVTVEVSLPETDQPTEVYLRYRAMTPEVGEWSETQSAQITSGSGTSSGSSSSELAAASLVSSSATFTLTGLSEDAEYEIQVSLNETFPEPGQAGDGTSETVYTGGAGTGELAVSAVTVGDISANSGTATVTLINKDEDDSPTVYLRYRTTNPQGDWSDSLEQTGADASVEFALSSLEASTEYEVQATLDQNFPDDQLISASFTTLELSALPIITAVTSGNEELTVNWTAPTIGSTDITAYDLRYIESDAEDKSDANWNVLQNILNLEPSTTPAPVDDCTAGLGTLTEDISVTAEWAGDCDSANRNGSYARFYTFTIGDDAEVAIDLTSDEDAYLFLLEGAGRDGTVEAENDDAASGNLNSLISATLTAGTYTVEATTYNPAITGEFTLTIAVETPGATSTPPPTDPAPDPAPADDCVVDLGTLTGDVVREGEWTGDCASTSRNDRFARFYTFNLGEEADLQVDLTSEEDTYLFLLAGGGRDVLYENDDADYDNDNLNSRLVITLEAGSYTLEATTYQIVRSGEFTLIIDLPDSPEGGTAGSSATEEADAGQRVDEGALTYTLSGLNYGTAYDLQVRAVTENGAGAWSATDTGTLDGAQTDRPAPADPCVTDKGTLTEDISVTGEWTDGCDSANRNGSYARFYTFTIEDDAEVAIDLTSDEDTYLFLLEGAGRDGTVEAENDDAASGNLNSLITTTLTAGTYTVEATTYNPAITGEFALAIAVGTSSETSTPPPADPAPEPEPEPAPADGCVVDLGTLTGDVVREGEWTGDCASVSRNGRFARFYTFNLEDEADLQVDLTSEEDTYLFLLVGGGRDGTAREENDDVDLANSDLNSRITPTLEAGTYTVEATTYESAATGQFTLTISKQ